MYNDLLLISLLFLQFLLIIYLVFQSRRKDNSAGEREKELLALKSEIGQQMQANRTEIQSGLLQQFGLLFDSLRANSKEQSEVLKDFGKLFRENVK